MSGAFHKEFPGVNDGSALPRPWRRHCRLNQGFTLIELLVVIVILGVIATLIIAGVRSVQDTAHRASCVSNLRQIGTGIMNYSGEHDGEIPYGPQAPPFTSPSNLYPSTGAPTSLISLQRGTPVALGLLLETYLSKTPQVLFCPGCDQKVDTKEELDKVNKRQAQCSYYYRHGGNTKLFDAGRKAPTPPPLKLSSLGDNRRGRPIRALVMDSMFLCPDTLDTFDVVPRTHHRRKYINVLFTDGSVATRPNEEDLYTIDVSDLNQIRTTFDKILKVFEIADDIGTAEEANNKKAK